jgi:hypothetical protein
MEETLRLMEQSGRTSMDLLKQALEVGASDSAENAQNKVQELWEASLRVLRNNAQSFTQANGKVVEAWMQLFTRSTPEGKPKTKAA